MASKVKVKIKRARDLPIMDKNQHIDASTDAFVECRFDEQTYRTQTRKKSLNPSWDEEFTFEFVDDSVLQSCPLEIRVLDQDTYTSEVIGTVYIDLNPLLMKTAYNLDVNDLNIKGWYPLFDTVAGLRGRILVSVKLIYLGSYNTSPAGVHFFSCATLSTNAFIIKELYGFVEDMIVEDDDPETKWKGYFRKSSKASNDHKWKSIHLLCTQVRQEIARKVAEVGGNAVLGYKVSIDMPSATAIVVRANGTAGRIYKVNENQSIYPSSVLNAKNQEKLEDYIQTNGTNEDSKSPHRVNLIDVNIGVTSFDGLLDISQLLDVENESILAQVLRSCNLNRNVADSNDNDTGAIESGNSNEVHNDSITTYMQVNSTDGTCQQILSLIPFGPLEKTGIIYCDLSGSSSSSGGIRSGNIPCSRSLLNEENQGDDISAAMKTNAGGSELSMYNSANANAKQEVMLFTMRNFPNHMRIRLGGLVSAKSVKYLGKVEHNSANIEQKTQEVWWEELRDEIKNHARTLCCTHIIGYSEYCTLFNDICVLSAVGTAAVIKYTSYPLLTLKSINQNVIDANFNDVLEGIGNHIVSDLLLEEKEYYERKVASLSESESTSECSDSDRDGELNVSNGEEESDSSRSGRKTRRRHRKKHKKRSNSSDGSSADDSSSSDSKIGRKKQTHKKKRHKKHADSSDGDHDSDDCSSVGSRRKRKGKKKHRRKTISSGSDSGSNSSDSCESDGYRARRKNGKKCNPKRDKKKLPVHLPLDSVTTPSSTKMNHPFTPRNDSDSPEDFSNPDMLLHMGGLGVDDTTIASDRIEMLDEKSIDTNADANTNAGVIDMAGVASLLSAPAVESSSDRRIGGSNDYRSTQTNTVDSNASENSHLDNEHRYRNRHHHRKRFQQQTASGNFHYSTGVTGDTKHTKYRLPKSHRIRPCTSMHVPYNHRQGPFNFMRLVPCLCCERKWVPECLLSTMEPTAFLPIRGKGTFLEARVCKYRKSAIGETDAVRISELLPFIEYDLQRQVTLKLKLLGMNAAFGYSSNIQIGNTFAVATVTCTAMYVEALPPPPALQIHRPMRLANNNDTEVQRLYKIQNDVNEVYTINKQILIENVRENNLIEETLRQHKNPRYSIQDPCRKKRQGSHSGDSSSSSGSSSSSESLSDSSSSSSGSDTYSSSDSDSATNSSLESPSSASSSSDSRRNSSSSSSSDTSSSSSDTSSYDSFSCTSSDSSSSSSDSSTSSGSDSSTSSMDKRSESSSSSSESGKSDSRGDDSQDIAVRKKHRKKSRRRKGKSSKKKAKRKQIADSGSGGSEGEGVITSRGARSASMTSPKGGSVSDSGSDRNTRRRKLKLRRRSSTVTSGTCSSSGDSTKKGKKHRLKSKRRGSIVSSNSSTSGSSSSGSSKRKYKLHKRKNNPRRRAGAAVTSSGLKRRRGDEALFEHESLLYKKRLGIYKRRQRKFKKVVYRDERTPYVVEIDDETDVDLLAAITDWETPFNFDFVNLPNVPGCKEVPIGTGKLIVLHRRFKLKNGVYYEDLASGSVSKKTMGESLNQLYKDEYLRLCYAVRDMPPCQVTSLSHSLNVLEDDVVELYVYAMVYRRVHPIVALLHYSHGEFDADSSRDAHSDSEDGSVTQSVSVANNVMVGAVELDADVKVTDSSNQLLSRQSHCSLNAAHIESVPGAADTSAMVEVEQRNPNPVVNHGEQSVSCLMDDSNMMDECDDDYRAQWEAAGVKKVASMSSEVEQMRQLYNTTDYYFESLRHTIRMALFTYNNMQHRGDGGRTKLLRMDSTSTALGRMPSTATNFTGAAKDLDTILVRDDSVSNNVPVSSSSSVPSTIGNKSSIRNCSEFEFDQVRHNALCGRTGSGSIELDLNYVDASPTLLNNYNNSISQYLGLPIKNTTKALEDFAHCKAFLPCESLNFLNHADSHSHGHSSIAISQQQLMSSVAGISVANRSNKSTNPNTTANGDAYEDAADAKYGGVTNTNEVMLTTHNNIPGTRILKYMGPLLLNFVKESWHVKTEIQENVTDPGTFAYVFINEVNSATRSHVVAVGGNVLLNYRITSQESGGRAYKNQSYSMLTVTGDIAVVHYGAR